MSPLLGAFYLLEFDRKMEKLDVKYFRYMDDILILAPTRWKLKKAIRVLNQTFNELKLEKHPDKTLMGRTERGFDFLGYHFESDGQLSVYNKTIERFKERIVRLYEQGADASSIGQYVWRWLLWARSGMRTIDGVQKKHQWIPISVNGCNQANMPAALVPPASATIECA